MRRLNRALPWVVGGMLFVGVLTFWQSVARPDPRRETFAEGRVGAPGSPRSVPLAPEAQRVAVRFLQTAVPRRNLAEAWKLSGPGIRQNLTLHQWLTGDIPVVEYPAGPEQAPVKIDWSYPREAGLQVALKPKQGAGVEPQVFFLGLKKHRGRWVVDYFAPYEQTVLPSQG